MDRKNRRADPMGEAIPEALAYFCSLPRHFGVDDSVEPGTFPPDAGVANRPRSLILNVPFCRAKCSYCRVATRPGRNRPAVDAYVDAVLRTVELHRGLPGWSRAPVRTIGVQGGTPSDLDADVLRRLLPALTEGVNRTDRACFFVEAHPARCDRDRMEVMRAAGVNMLLAGVQALSAPLLKTLGCHHTADDVQRFCGDARSAGFPLVASYLLVGVPGQTTGDIEEAIRTLDAWGVNVIVTLALRDETGRVKEPVPFAQARDHLLAADALLGSLGLLPAYQSAYVKAPAGGAPDLVPPPLILDHDCIALGADDFGSVGGRRYWNVDDLAEYQARAAAGRFPLSFAEVGPRGSEAMAWWLAESLLRLEIDRDAFERRFQTDLDDALPVIGVLESRDLLAPSERGYVPTAAGRVLMGRYLPLVLRRPGRDETHPLLAPGQVADDEVEALDELIDTPRKARKNTLRRFNIPDGMRLSVPWNHDFELVKALEPFAGYVANLYAPFHPSVAWTTRQFSGATSIEAYRAELDRLAVELTRLGWGLTLVSNIPLAPVDVPALVAEAARLAPRVPRLRVTFADPWIARTAMPGLRKAGVEIGVSLAAKVASAAKATMWRDMAAAGHVVVAPEINRNADELRRIRALGVSLGALAFDECLPNCPSMGCQMRLERSGNDISVVFDVRGDCPAPVAALRAEKPWLLASKEVLPGHLRHLAGLVDEIKLPGRDTPTKRILAWVKLYLEALSLEHPDGFYREPVDLWDHLASCDRNCLSCSFCAEHLEWKPLAGHSGERGSATGGERRVATAVSEVAKEPGRTGNVQVPSQAAAAASSPDEGWTFTAPGGISVRIWIGPPGVHEPLRRVGQDAVFYRMVQGEFTRAVADLVHAVADALGRAGGRGTSLPASPWPHGFIRG